MSRGIPTRRITRAAATHPSTIISLISGCFFGKAWRFSIRETDVCFRVVLEVSLGIQSFRGLRVFEGKDHRLVFEVLAKVRISVVADFMWRLTLLLDIRISGTLRPKNFYFSVNYILVNSRRHLPDLISSRIAKISVFRWSSYRIWCPKDLESRDKRWSCGDAVFKKFQKFRRHVPGHSE